MQLNSLGRKLAVSHHGTTTTGHLVLLVVRCLCNRVCLNFRTSLLHGNRLDTCIVLHYQDSENAANVWSFNLQALACWPVQHISPHALQVWSRSLHSCLQRSDFGWTHGKTSVCWHEPANKPIMVFDERHGFAYILHLCSVRAQTQQV